MIQIIGYGNPLRSDDGVGWHVANRLADEWESMIDVLTLHQLTPELAEVIPDASMVIFIDAVAKHLSTDLIECRPLQPEEAINSLTHHCSPQAILLYAKRLYGKNLCAFLISVSAENLDHGDQLSPHAQQSAEAAVTCANALIAEELVGWIPPHARDATGELEDARG